MEVIRWLPVLRQTYEAGNLLGCMGGAEGVDCPRGCQVQDVTRTGIGLRAAAEYNIRLGSEYPRASDWVFWFTLGLTRAVSEREEECCYFDDKSPLRRDCPLVR